MESERAQVVEPQNVVGMRMGIEHGVEPADLFTDSLGTKIGGGVDDDDMTVILEHDRRAGTAVVRIDGATDFAHTPDGGHAHGGAAPQHCEGSLHFLKGFPPPVLNGSLPPPVVNGLEPGTADAG